MVNNRTLIEGIAHNANSIAAMDVEMAVRLQSLEAAMKVISPEMYEAYQFALAERISYRLAVAKDYAVESGDLNQLAIVNKEIGKASQQTKKLGTEEGWKIGKEQARKDIKSGVLRKGPTLVEKSTDQ